MDRSTPIKLEAVTYTADAIGQMVETVTERTVYCNLRSVSRSEWQAAGEMGLKAAYQATMFAPDYNGEETAILNGTRYGIYRTYLGANETIELYLEKKGGV